MGNPKHGEVSYPSLLPSKVDLRQVTIIPHDEWKRIQDSLGGLTREAAALRAERKAKREMHLRSQEVVKHWTNTYAVSVNPLEVHMALKNYSCFPTLYIFMNNSTHKML